MAEQNIPSTTDPAPTSQPQNITLAPGSPVKLDVALDEATFSVNGPNLVISVDDGREIILQNYFTLAESGDIPYLEFANNIQVPGDAYLQDFEGELETAAGPAGGAGGTGSGAGQYSDDPGAIYDGLGLIGGQGGPEILYSVSFNANGEDNSIPIITSEATDLEIDETDGLGIIATGSVSANFGNDEPGSYSLSAPNSFWQDNGNGTGTLTHNEGLWEIDLNLTTGFYTVTLLQPIDHPDTSDPDDIVQYPITATARDADGDTATSDFILTIRDDGPTITPQIVLQGEIVRNGEVFEEMYDIRTSMQDGPRPETSVDDVSFYHNGGLLSIDVIRESSDQDFDGDGDTNEFFDPQIYLFRIGENGAPTQVATNDDGGIGFNSLINGDFPEGNYILKVSGYRFTSTEAANNQNIIGDTSLWDGGSTGPYQVTLVGDISNVTSTTMTNPLQVVRDETDGFVPKEVSAEELGIDFGTDGEGEIELSMLPQEEGGGYSEWNPDTKILQYFQDGPEGEATWQIELTGSAETGYGYKFTQLQAIDHDTPGDGEVPPNSHNENAHWDVILTVTDGDGDPVSANISIDIKDDGPTAQFNPNFEGINITLDESDERPKKHGGNRSDESDFSIIFTTGVDIDYGTDGAGSVSYAFQLSENGIFSGFYAVDSQATNPVGQGEQILLKQGQDTGNIIGYTQSDNLEFFTISLDSNSGVVTFTQVGTAHNANTIWHKNTNDSDDPETLTLGENDYLEIVQTITDADNDTSSIALNLGYGVFTIEDDGPKLSIKINKGKLQDLEVTLDESLDITFQAKDRYSDDDTAPWSGNTDDVDGDSSILGQVSTNISNGLTGLFSIRGNYGNDGPGTTEGELSFTGLPDGGLTTNLSATDGGVITLHAEGDHVEGRDNDDHVVFKIEIVDNQLQTTLYEAIDHSDSNSGNAFDDVINLYSIGEQEGKLALEYTVTRTDGDGDSITKSKSITLVSEETSIFSFEDDGPSSEALSQYSFDVTFNGGTAGYNNSYGYYVKSDDDTPSQGFIIWTNVKDHLNETITITLEPGLTPSDIGFFIIPDGADTNSNVTGFTDGAEVHFEGSGPSTQAFIGGTGLTGDQSAPIYFDNAALNKDTQQHLLNNTNTGNQNWEDLLIPNGDGDFDDVNITLQWNNPIFSPVITLDESALPNPSESPVVDDGIDDGIHSVTTDFSTFFAHDFGADGPANTNDVAYNLNLKDPGATGVGTELYARDTNALDGKGAEILLFAEQDSSGNDIIAGKLDGHTYFTISVNPVTGAVTFSLNPTEGYSIWHQVTENNDDAFSIVTDSDQFTLTQTVTDGDGDTAVSFISLGNGSLVIEDDGPTSISTPPVEATSTDIPNIITGSFNFSLENQTTDSKSLNNESGQITITAKGFTSASNPNLIFSDINFTDKGVGVASEGSPYHLLPNEVDYRLFEEENNEVTGKSEQLIITLEEGSIAYGAQIEFSKMYGGELESGIAKFYRNDQLIDEQQFDSDENSGNYARNFTVSQGGFDRIVLEAVGNGNTLAVTDNSDFTVKSITFTGEHLAPIAYATGQALVDWGTDDKGAYTNFIVLEDNLALPNNAQITLNYNGNTVTGVAGDTTVFTLEFTPATGTWEFYQYHEIRGLDDSTLNFQVTATDGDGDPIDVPLAVIPNQSPVELAVGSNAHDDSSGTDNTVPHVVDDADPTVNYGDIVGYSAPTVISGDSGSSAVISNFIDSRYILLLDTSGSMKDSTRLDQMQSALNDMLGKIYSQVDGSVDGKVEIILQPFARSAKDSVTITFDKSADLIKIGADEYEFSNTADLADCSAIGNWIDNLSAGGSTNYEAGLTKADNALSALPISDSFDNHVVFITDGEPNRYNISNRTQSGDLRAITDIFGMDGTDEVANIIASATIHSIGLGLDTTSNTQTVFNDNSHGEYTSNWKSFTSSGSVDTDWRGEWVDLGADNSFGISREIQTIEGFQYTLSYTEWNFYTGYNSSNITPQVTQSGIPVDIDTSSGSFTFWGTGETLTITLQPVQGAPNSWATDIRLKMTYTAQDLLNAIDSTQNGAIMLGANDSLGDALVNLLSTTTTLDSVGDDIISGQTGGDIIFGDVMNTDALAKEHDIDLPQGSGWEVFEQLETADNGWNRETTLQYIKENHEALAIEGKGTDGSGREGGNDIINGGTGNDIIYGQEGIDIINGGSGTDILNGGTGKDILFGGTENDTLIGGDGADIFVAGAGDTLIMNTISTGDGTEDIIYIDKSMLQADGGIISVQNFFATEDTIQLADGLIATVNNNQITVTDNTVNGPSLTLNFDSMITAADITTNSITGDDALVIQQLIATSQG